MKTYHDLRGESGKEFAEIANQFPTFVRYHMNNCGHCIAMEKEWDTLSKDISKDKNMDIHLVNLEQSGLDYVPDHLKKDIIGFPTLVLYDKDGKNRSEYQGERTADAMKEWLENNSNNSYQNGGRRNKRRHKKSLKKRSSRKQRKTKTNSKQRKTNKKGGKRRTTIKQRR